MNNEIQHIAETYFHSDENAIHFFGNGGRICDLSRFFRHLIPCDHPDAYAVDGNDVLILEHFEFDSSNNSKRKGSQQRRSQAEANRAFKAVIPTETCIPYHGNIEADYSMVNYKNNLLCSYQKHYREIPEYKKTLIEKRIITTTQNVSTMFFIEDMTVLGNIYEAEKYDNPLMPVILPHCDFFLELFANSPDLDMALCGSWYPNEYCLWYIDHSLICEYKQHMIETNKVSIINLNPSIVGGKIVIPHGVQEKDVNGS